MSEYIVGLCKLIVVNLVWGAIRCVLWIVLVAAGLVLTVIAAVATGVSLPETLNHAFVIVLAAAAGVVTFVVYYYTFFFAIEHNWLTWMYVDMGDDDFL